ncbi:MAG: N-acetylmuramoyl-L-alanine amidase, partial [Thermoleophilia bacterium]|nr:N-acetylmuramoyl-L-alanine amidase [Thermoleophilia bacterium]
MRWGRDRVVRRVARAATVLVLGTVAALALVWAAPRTSEAVGTWVKSPPKVKMHTVAVGPRLQVGRAGPADASPVERLQSAREAGSVTLDVGDRFTMLGLTCDVPQAEADIEVRVRTSDDGDEWSAWYAAPLEVVAEGDAAPRAFIDPLWTGEGRLVEVCASAAGDDAPLALTGVELVALDTEGGSGIVAAAAGVLRRAVATISGVGLAAPAAAAVETPDWVTRAGWGADESLRTGDPAYATVKMSFVHHTAGGNTYTADQAPGIVRGIYVYHTQSLDWSDIGYNFLVDRYGTVYVGRYGGPTKGVVGAHAYGFNTGSTGISVMGNFTDAAPPAAAMDALANLLAWKLEVHGLDPLGTAKMVCGATRIYTAGETVTLPVISGHRDVNYTACPGDAFYPKLSGLRTAAAAQIKLASVDPEPYAVTLALSASEVAVDTPVTYSGTVKTAAGAPAQGTVTVQKRLAPDGAWLDWRTAK